MTGGRERSRILPGLRAGRRRSRPWPGTFTFEFEVSVPLLVEKTSHGDATTYSLLIGSLGAGAVVGGLYAARARPYRGGPAHLDLLAYGLTMALAGSTLSDAISPRYSISILLGAVACVAAAVIGRWPRRPERRPAN